MKNPEIPKQESEKHEETHLTPLIRGAREVVGSYDKNVNEKDIWDEKKISARMDGLLRGHPKLLDIYNYNADSDRRQVLRLNADATRQERQPTVAERKERSASLLRITVNESFSRAIDAYMGLFEEYDSWKAQGLVADRGAEETSIKHLERIRAAAETRRDVAVQLKAMPVTGRPDPARLALQKQAKEADNEMVRLLLCDDEKNIPGGNKQGLLPVYTLMLSQLEKEYTEDVLKQYRSHTREKSAAVKNRVEQANELFRQVFKTNNAKDIPEDKADDALKNNDASPYKGKGTGSGLVQYRDDLAILKDKKSAYEGIKSRGEQNIQRLAHLNAAMGRYQIHRVQLATLRHGIDQGYHLTKEERPPLAGSTPEQDVVEMQGWLKSQQQGSVSSLSAHLHRVDEDVLKVGWKEKAESLWNHKGRVFMAKVAKAIVSLETGWIPDVPGMTNSDFFRQSARDYLLKGEDGGSLYDAMGWPRDENGRLKDKLTKEEQMALEKKQQSIEDAIKKFKETGALPKVQESVGAAQILINRRDIHPEDYFSGPIDPANLPKVRVNAKNVNELIEAHGAPAIYKLVFVQLSADWESYSANYKTMLTEFHQVIGVHLDMERYFKEFGDKQMNILWLILTAMGASALAGYIGPKIAKKVVSTAKKKILGIQTPEEKLKAAKEEVLAQEKENAELRKKLKLAEAKPGTEAKTEAPKDNAAGTRRNARLVMDKPLPPEHRPATEVDKARVVTVFNALMPGGGLLHTQQSYNALPPEEKDAYERKMQDLAGEGKVVQGFEALPDNIRTLVAQELKNTGAQPREIRVSNPVAPAEVLIIKVVEGRAGKRIAIVEGVRKVR